MQVRTFKGYPTQVLTIDANGGMDDRKFLFQEKNFVKRNDRQSHRAEGLDFVNPTSSAAVHNPVSGWGPSDYQIQELEKHESLKEAARAFENKGVIGPGSFQTRNKRSPKRHTYYQP
jgi:hypothetical protein